MLKDESHIWFNWSFSPSLAVNVRGMVLASSRLLVPGTGTSASDYEKWVGNSVYVTINMNSMNNIMVTGCMKSWSSHEFNNVFWFFLLLSILLNVNSCLVNTMEKNEFPWPRIAPQKTFFIQMGLHILSCRKIELLQFTIKPKNSSFIVKLRKRAFKRTYFITYTLQAQPALIHDYITMLIFN